MDILSEELKRIRSDSPNLKPLSDSIGVIQFKAICFGNADFVLRRAKEVLERVVSVHKKGFWPDFDYWISELPDWFIGACADEMSIEDAERWLEQWRQLTPEAQAKQIIVLMHMASEFIDDCIFRKLAFELVEAPLDFPVHRFIFIRNLFWIKAIDFFLVNASKHFIENIIPNTLEVIIRGPPLDNIAVREDHQFFLKLFVAE